MSKCKKLSSIFPTTDRIITRSVPQNPNIFSLCRPIKGPKGIFTAKMPLRLGSCFSMPKTVVVGRKARRIHKMDKQASLDQDADDFKIISVPSQTNAMNKIVIPSPLVSLTNDREAPATPSTSIFTNNKKKIQKAFSRMIAHKKNQIKEFFTFPSFSFKRKRHQSNDPAVAEETVENVDTIEEMYDTIEVTPKRPFNTTTVYGTTKSLMVAVDIAPIAAYTENNISSTKIADGPGYLPIRFRSAPSSFITSGIVMPFSVDAGMMIAIPRKMENIIAGNHLSNTAAPIVADSQQQTRMEQSSLTIEQVINSEQDEEKEFMAQWKADAEKYGDNGAMRTRFNFNNPKNMFYIGGGHHRRAPTSMNVFPTDPASANNNGIVAVSATATNTTASLITMSQVMGFSIGNGMRVQMGFRKMENF